MQTLEEQGYIIQSIAKPFSGKPISKTFSNVPSPLHPKYIQTPKFQGKNKIIMLIDKWQYLISTFHVVDVFRLHANEVLQKNLQ